MYKYFIKFYLKDSGRSSDSSSRTSLDNHRILESPRQNRYQGTSLPTSTSASAIDKKPLQEINSQPTRGNYFKINFKSKCGNGSFFFFFPPQLKIVLRLNRLTNPVAGIQRLLRVSLAVLNLGQIYP